MEPLTSEAEMVGQATKMSYSTFHVLTVWGILSS